MKSDSQLARSASKRPFAVREDPNVERKYRKLENRRKLLAAARRLFIERGANEITTHDIAELAGVVHGTFYNHFKDKTDCYIAFLEDVEEELCYVVDWYYCSEGTPSEVISAWLAAIFSYSSANPGIMNALLSDFEVLSKFHERMRRKHPVFFRRMELLDTWKRIGKAAPDFDNEYFFAMLQGMVKHGISVIDRNPELEEKVIQETTKFLVRSIKAD